MRTLRPVRKFAVLSSLAIACLCLALALVVTSILERHLREAEWQSTAAIVRYALEEHDLIPKLMEAQGHRNGEGYLRALRGLERLPEVVRIKVWDRNATILWSDDEQLIGRSFPDNPGVKQALAGRTDVELTNPGELTRKYGEEQFAHLAEIYVPVRASPTGEILGLVEVYKIPARLLTEIRRTRVLVWGIVLAGGLLLNLGLLWTRELKAANQQLENLSVHDSLTNLDNHREFRRRLAVEVERARRYDHPFSLLFLDIDHFKAVNDSFGHQAGDEVLRGLAALVRETIRPIDQAARFGGDEFAILMPETPASGALVVAERVRRLIASQAISVATGQAITITVSIGVATFPKEAESEDLLVGTADRALYAAKHAGRNRVHPPPDSS